MKSLLIFIHGLTGNGKDTWGNFPSLIEKDARLGETFDVKHFEYTTKKFDLPFTDKSSPIHHLAETLEGKINNNYREYKNIILICHSMGGLIARKYLTDIIKKIKAEKELKKMCVLEDAFCLRHQI
jgi:triacylglycerol esterase/lipase EstA (alpha/beta hydrolase family)